MTPGARPARSSSKLLLYRTLGPYGDAGFSYPVLRSREKNITLSSLVYGSDNESDALGAPFTDDRLRGFRSKVDADFADQWHGINQFNVTFSQGIQGLGSTSNNNPLASRLAGRVDYDKIEATAARNQALFDQFSAYVSLYGQYAGTPLLVPEQCGFGGRYFGRAFDPSQLLGDSCFETVGELRYDLPAKLLHYVNTVQFYGYTDYGDLYTRDAAPGHRPGLEGPAGGLGRRRRQARLVRPHRCRPLGCEGNRGSDQRHAILFHSERAQLRQAMARRWHNAVLTATALLPFAVASAFAGPNGAHVVGGAATVQGQGTGNVVVNQSSQNAIINWQTFNIGSGETTKILMPNSSSTQLDRVTGGQGPSQILGTLYSNGKIFLVNPDGILFGMGASINVGSLLATTNNITNKNFMAGRYKFTIPGNPNASIVNMGSITAQTGGFAALVAPGVRNTGTITAKLGTIALASGNAFTLDMYGDNLITLGLTDSISSQVVDVATGQPLKSLVSNEGKLKANGGTVTLTAAAARAVVDSVINNSGVIEANSIGSHNGMIVLGAATAATKPPGSPTQTVTVSGKLSAKGKRKGTTGGTIIVTGENIAVSGASINASGKAGGGTVLIGGDWGGGHPNTSLVSGNASAALQPYAVPNSSTVSIDAATMIDASATATGNGGKVIVWANQATTFLGTILAKGGAQSGNGGFVETSGGDARPSTAAVNTSAPNGKTGTWLLDPTDLTIDASGRRNDLERTSPATTSVVYTDAERRHERPRNNDWLQGSGRHHRRHRANLLVERNTHADARQLTTTSTIDMQHQYWRWQPRAKAA